jgi:hypothetical protein
MYLPAPSSAPYASASPKQTQPEAQAAAGVQQPNSRRKPAASSQTQLLEADLPADGRHHLHPFYVIAMQS